VALEVFAAVGTVFPVEKETEFDAIFATVHMAYVKPGSGAGTEAGDDQSNWNTTAAALTEESHALTVRMSVFADRQVRTGRSPRRRWVSK
jgi:hypothetical protein